MIFGMSGASETRAPKPSALNGFEETVKDFWASRPRRPHSGRKVAGVAAGIGYRYGIDPVVVRIALVVTTIFGGFGLTFYLLAWLFLPGESDDVSGFESLIGRGRSSVSPAFAVVLAVLTVVSAGGTFSATWFDGGGLISFALIATALYLLHRSRGHLNRPAPVVTRSRSGASTGNGAFTMTDTATAEATSPAQGWDPLAADPAGWDLPEAPSAHEPPPTAPPSYGPPQHHGRRPRSKVGSVTFALAVLTAGGGVLANLNGAELVLRAAHHRPGARRGRDRPGHRRVRPRRARPDRARGAAGDRRDDPDDRAVPELRRPRRRSATSTRPRAR